jgi:uncharacterized membrane protein YqaE (UPF0057 family)
MNRIQLINLVFLTSLVFSLGACKTSSDVVSSNWIQKRKYTKGFYVAKKAKADNDQANASTAPLPEKESFEELEVISISTNDDTSADLNHFKTHDQRDVPFKSKNETTIENTEKIFATERHIEAAEPLLSAPLTIQPFTEMKTLIDQSAKKNPTDDTELILMIVCAIVLPPLAVFLMYGIETEFWISLLLTIIVWLPGIIYALYHVFKNY